MQKEAGRKEEGKRKELRRVPWALQKRLYLTDQGQSHSRLNTRPLVKVPFVLPSKSHMGVE